MPVSRTSKFSSRQKLKTSISSRSRFKPIKAMWKFVIVSLALAVSLAASAKTDLLRSQSVDATQLSVPRFIEKTFSLATQLFKVFNSLKSESKDEKKIANIKHDLVPYDGLNYDPMHADWYNQEAIAEHKEKEKPEPQFWVFDNFSKKVDLIFLTKVILKIIVFKKIVKFIALVCLLFFLPTLKDDSTTHTDSSEEKDGRSLDIYDHIDYRTKEILSFAIHSVEGFSLDKMVWCVAEHDAFCRFQTMFDVVDQIYTVDQIIKWWYPKSAPVILKVIDKLKLPEVTSTKPEAYLQLPGDSDEFPIEVSDGETLDETPGSDEESQEANEIDSEEREKEDL